MPRSTRRTRNTKRRETKFQDDTESESGKLSETQEVAKRLSRTRLGKENAVRTTRQSCPKKGPTDPYDADSEVESDINLQEPMPERTPMSPMVTDSLTENINFNPPLSAIRLRTLKTLSPAVFHQDHSTPDINTPGKSDDSLFGFGAVMESPLTFSPIGDSSVHQASVHQASVMVSPVGSSFSITSAVSAISPGKRKLQLRLFDMPIEKPPAKKQKKKKQKQTRQETPQDNFGNTLAEFEEVEMFDLVIQ